MLYTINQYVITGVPKSVSQCTYATVSQDKQLSFLFNGINLKTHKDVDKDVDNYFDMCII